MNKRVLNRLAFCIFVCVFVSSFSAVQAKESTRKFQIDVIAISTPLGTPTVTEQMSLMRKTGISASPISITSSRLRYWISLLT